MTNLLIISAFLYLAWVLLYIKRGQIRKFMCRKTKLPPIIPTIEPTDDDVMGKTKTMLRHVETNDDSLRQIEKPVEIVPTFAASNGILKSARIDDNELDSAFSDSPEPMDLDIECEYYEAESHEEEDDINCFINEKLTGSATGVEYDEMENLIQVMQQSGSSQEAELNAVNTIQELNQTELFQLMVAQIDGGKERVAEMLNKHNSDSLGTKPIIAEITHANFEEFEINNFL
jgi:hypothetical protein